MDYERLRGLQTNSRRSPGDTASGVMLISPVEVERARVNLRDADSKLRAAQARLDAGVQGILALDEQLKLYTLATPHKGRLGRVQVVPGQTLSVGTLVAEVVDLEEEIDVLCYVAPGTARKLAMGQTARLGGIDNPANSAGDVEGKVVLVSDQAEA